MSRETWVFRGGKMVRKTSRQASSQGIMVISDSLPDLLHPATGKRYDSKSRFRAETRVRGLVEFGTEQQKRRPVEMSPVAPAIKQAIEKLRSGYRPQMERATVPGGADARGPYPATPITRVIR